jgi:hypothetical protein
MEALSSSETRDFLRSQILAALDEAETDIANGRFLDYTGESLPLLGTEIKRQARAMFPR